MTPATGAAIAAPVRADKHGERGMITIELAVGVLIAVIVTTGLVAGITVGLSHAAAVASAQQIALHTARNDDAGVLRARDEVPDGGTVEITREEAGVEVRVTVRPWMPVVGEVVVAAGAWARWEPGAGP